MTRPQPSPRKWRVTVIEWLSHVAIIEADTAQDAEARAYELWANNAEHEVFRFSDAGIDGVVADEV
jgi:hypothetical protein